ncbi:TIR domain-containing protein [Paenibacillus oenotherae]|uniref:TIR domain-containing protein n=1 Tax=Paenibacillus oenotherae TaxID=1435645 RepID=A0ABS7D6X5_9BACL|nr:TIR domain-containing protein [Paenibacillus oenotherae]MBW7475687.1 TIR domain-containing protein [Paenibacillus oenotherae]
MANRTGTYVAFDGLGETDPTKSDFKYYATLQAWSSNKNIQFSLTNSHEKTDAVRDTSKRATLYARIQERLRASKNMLVILSSKTRFTGSVLSYEIEQAIDNYNIPLIIAYPEFSSILNVEGLSGIWPKALTERINKTGVEAIHIPFAKECILNAITRFHVNGEHLSSGKNYYNRETQVEWGLIR